MGYEIEEIVRTLRLARETKGVSQRMLSAKVNVPQSHISKIETGAVDLRVSSLLALARVLDLELILIPRRALSAVQSVVRASELDVVTQTIEVYKELRLLKDTLTHLSKSIKGGPKIDQMQRRLREIEHFQLQRSNLVQLKEIRKILVLSDKNRGAEAIGDALARIQKLRNSLAHASAHTAMTSAVRPAYSLEEDGDA